MTLLLLIVWAIAGHPASLAEPWSAWFVALLVAAVLD